MTESQEPPSPPSAKRTQAFGLALLAVGAIIALVALGPPRMDSNPEIKQASVESGAVEKTDSVVARTQYRESADDWAELRPLGAFPDRVEQAPVKIYEAYAFVADPDNHVLVQSLKCYCGCDSGLEHPSLFNCYIDELRSKNQAIYSDHGIGCLTCLSEVWETSNWKAAGKTPVEIKELIDSNYGARTQ